MKDNFNKQVELLLKILPFVAKEKDFALHGGTAINLFYFNFPRMSVDIDLTYIPIKNRDTDLLNIKRLLTNIKFELIKQFPKIIIRQSENESDEYKLYCTNNGFEIKIEVNTINRGVYKDIKTFLLCDNAQELYNTFCEIQIVSIGQLFGGKIIAALYRQHPRDLFDVKNIINTIGLTDEVLEGVLFCLLSSKRPFCEILNPRLINQKTVLENHFNGMTIDAFSYEEFEETRKILIDQIVDKLADKYARFILDFADGNPDLETINFEKFPGIRWKLLNIKKLKFENIEKHKSQLIMLESILKIY
jgi:predicted nucleotidyltransferase component of viral defense system